MPSSPQWTWKRAETPPGVGTLIAEAWPVDKWLCPSPFHLSGANGPRETDEIIQLFGFPGAGKVRWFCAACI